MVRKAIITVLTLATVGSAWVWVATVVGIISSRAYGWDMASFRTIWLMPGKSELGVMYATFQLGSFSPTYYAASYPWWLLVVVFGAYPFYSLLRLPARRRRRRREQGLCLDCGYDLTGNVTGVCSECGSKARSRGRLTDNVWLRRSS